MQNACIGIDVPSEVGSQITVNLVMKKCRELFDLKKKVPRAETRS